MVPSTVYLCVILSIITSGLCGSCNNPKVTSKSFTTQDATIVTNIAYVSEFEVKCDGGAEPNLYADIDGNLTPVSIVGKHLFQVINPLLL